MADDTSETRHVDACPDCGGEWDMQADPLACPHCGLSSEDLAAAEAFYAEREDERREDVA